MTKAVVYAFTLKYKWALDECIEKNGYLRNPKPKLCFSLYFQIRKGARRPTNIGAVADLDHEPTRKCFRKVVRRMRFKRRARRFAYVLSFFCIEMRR